MEGNMISTPNLSVELGGLSLQETTSPIQILLKKSNEEIDLEAQNRETSPGTSTCSPECCQDGELPKLRHVPPYLADYFQELVPDEPPNTSDSESAADSPEPIGLLDLPMEIIEPIVLSLDGHTLIHLEQCSNLAREIVREIMGGDKGYHFWKKECLTSLQKSLSHKILSSFYNVVAEPLRIEVIGEEISDAMEFFTYEGVFRSVFNLMTTLKYSGIKLQHLAKQDDQIKTEVLWNYNQRSATTPWPARFTSTVGPTLFNIIVPSAWPEWEPYVMYIFENMKQIRRQTIAPLREEEMYYYLIMDYPVKKPETDLPSGVNETLPIARKIFVGVFEKSIYLTHINHGQSHRISTTSDLIYMHVIHMPPPIAILDDFLGVWTHPDVYKLFRIHVDPQFGHVTSTLLMTMQHWRMGRIWQYVASKRLSYLTRFSTKTGELATRSDNWPAFTIMSPIFGTYIFESSDPEDGVLFQEPVVYTDTSLPFITKFENPIGSADGHGTIFFWSAELFTVGFLVHKWFLQTWKEVGIFETVKMAEVIAPRLVMLNTKDEIIIIKLMYSTPHEPHQNFRPAGRRYNYLEVEIIRRIPTDILTRHGFINHFHFDFDKAKPYIFLVLEAFKPRDGGSHCNFFLKKLVFGNRGRNERSRIEAKGHRDFPDVCDSYFMDPKNKRITTLLKTFQANIL